MQTSIDNLIVDLSKKPFDPKLNFQIAEAYLSIGQTAAAVSFYLRTAEYGYKTHKLEVYASLLKAAKCFEHQKNRKHTVLNLALKAAAYIPNRPEAWLFLSQWYEQDKKWQESYTYAETGLTFYRKNLKELPIQVGYPGEYALRFQKGVSAWWVGRKDESISLFKELLLEDIAPIYRDTIVKNLQQIDI